VCSPAAGTGIWQKIQQSRDCYIFRRSLAAGGNLGGAELHPLRGSFVLDRLRWPGWLVFKQRGRAAESWSQRALFLSSSRTGLPTIEGFIRSGRDREQWAPGLGYAQQNLHGQLVATASSPDRLQLIGLHCVKNSGIEKRTGEKKRIAAPPGEASRLASGCPPLFNLSIVACTVMCSGTSWGEIHPSTVSPRLKLAWKIRVTPGLPTVDWAPLEPGLAAEKRADSLLQNFQALAG